MSISVKRPEGVVEFCTDLALRADWEAAVAELEDVRKKASIDDRLGDPSIAAAVAKVQGLEEQMRAATLKFRLGALRRRRWQELGEEHPPRDGNKQDAAMGVNIDTFFDAVLVQPGAIFAVNKLVSNDVVDFDPSVEWSTLADDMTDGQYKDFVDEVLALNRGVTSAPFSRTASLLTRLSEENSNSPSNSGSPTEG